MVRCEVSQQGTVYDFETFFSKRARGILGTGTCCTLSRIWGCWTHVLTDVIEKEESRCCAVLRVILCDLALPHFCSANEPVPDECYNNRYDRYWKTHSRMFLKSDMHIIFFGLFDGNQIGYTPDGNEITCVSAHQGEHV